ncbi:MAG: AAA family ATPase [Phascolarctobacterium sp.]|nr:AAA family ATPase [Phascolarctobacterium sp.]
MIFYKIDVDLRAEMRDAAFINKFALEVAKENDEDPCEKFLKKVNKVLDNQTSKETLVIQAYQLKETVLSLVCGCNVEREVDKEILGALDNALKFTILKDVKVDCMEEITAQAFVNYINLAETSSDYVMRGNKRRRRWIDEFDIEYLRDDAYQAKEYVFDKLEDQAAVLAEAKKIMADETLLEELKYIYCAENCRQFYGVPVHYKVVASSRKSALKIIEVLVCALSQVNRLLGNRVNYLCDYEFDNFIDEENFESLFEKAQGATTVVELFNADEEDNTVSFANNGFWKYLEKNVVRFKKKSLVIFVELLGKSRNAKRVLNRYAEKIDIVEIKEGVGSAQDVEDFLMNMLAKSEYKDFVNKDEIKDMLAEEKVHNLTAAYDVYDRWNENVLKEKIYPAYKPLANKLEVKATEPKEKNASLEELKSLIGLAPVKGVVKQMVATYIMQRARKSAGLKTDNFSRHMIFTGNPGAAKTTVARLLAGIFATEGITASAKFVECGRSDLVGQYVGWTAPAVKEKFKEARGGILFIDEAYALVESHNSFGDEAINTIVQEMENHRDDVIVIFAGYPDKMKDFLNKNEGLRSRIAFHVNFPDYSVEELVEILKLMTKQQGYKLHKDVIAKVEKIFASVCKHPEFGNGRFVRNMVEQAIMKQAVRVFDTYGKKKYTEKQLCTLTAEDFDENIAAPFKEMQAVKRIGFMG